MAKSQTDDEIGLFRRLFALSLLTERAVEVSDIDLQSIGGLFRLTSHTVVQFGEKQANYSRWSEIDMEATMQCQAVGGPEIAESNTRDVVSPNASRGTRTSHQNSRVPKAKNMPPTPRHVRKEADLEKLAAPLADEGLMQQKPQSEPETPNELDEIISVVQQLEQFAFHNPQAGPGLVILTKTRAFLDQLVDLLVLRRAFRVSPRRAIEGPDGVAEILNIAKATVHDRVKSLGLTVDQMRDPRYGFAMLISSSSALSEAKSELFSLYEKYQLSPR
jgi:hypothetical protein